MKRAVIFIAVGILFSLTGLLAQPKADDDYTISGNAAGSTNTVDVAGSAATTNNQTNSAQVTNDVTVTADTGGNSTSENDGNANITTGDARVSVSINNALNQNTAIDPGCCSPTPLPTTPAAGGPTGAVFPTTTATPPTDGGTGGGPSDPGQPSGKSAQAEAPSVVLGLSDTTSIDWSLVTKIVGILCVATGSILLTKKSVSV